MDIEEKNPWAVRNLKEFLYFCCPECDVKNQSEELFLQHALNEHPKAKECIPKLEFKQEIDEEVFINDVENLDQNLPNPNCVTIFSDIVKCENEEKILKNGIKKSSTKKVKYEENDAIELYPEEFSHFEDSGYEYECKDCDRKFKTLPLFTTHIKNVHEAQESHKCYECGKTFCNKKYLKSHIELKHGSVFNFKCDICGKGFGYEPSLRNHMKECHEKSKVNIEEISETKVEDVEITDDFDQEDKPNLENSNFQDPSKFKFECEHCHKKFERLSIFTNHVKSVHEGQRDHPCEQCGKAFSR